MAIEKHYRKDFHYLPSVHHYCTIGLPIAQLSVPAKSSRRALFVELECRHYRRVIGVRRRVDQGVGDKFVAEHLVVNFDGSV